MNTYRIASRKALCNSPNFHLIEKLDLWHVQRIIAWEKFAHFHFQFTQLMKKSTSLIAKPTII